MFPSNPVITQGLPNLLPSRLGVSTSMISGWAGTVAPNAIGASSLSLPQAVAFAGREQQRLDSKGPRSLAGGDIDEKADVVTADSFGTVDCR